MIVTIRAAADGIVQERSCPKIASQSALADIMKHFLTEKADRLSWTASFGLLDIFYSK